jgi:hypothetical protein
MRDHQLESVLPCPLAEIRQHGDVTAEDGLNGSSNVADD